MRVRPCFGLCLFPSHLQYPTLFLTTHAQFPQRPRVWLLGAPHRHSMRHVTKGQPNQESIESTFSKSGLPTAEIFFRTSHLLENYKFALGTTDLACSDEIIGAVDLVVFHLNLSITYEQMKIF